MDNVFSPSSPQYPHATFLRPNQHHLSVISSLSFSLKSSPPQPPEPNNLRRPSNNPLKSSAPKKTTPNNPLKTLTNPYSLSSKLFLSSKLSPTPPPPPPPPPPPLFHETQTPETETQKIVEFRQEGKIFIGNLPSWIKKPDITEFFRQFGPVKAVILIKGHNETERNAGFGFVIYDGPKAEKAAMKAVEFDGVEFHGRVLTVKLDDGRRMKAKAVERARWVEGEDGDEWRSKWHEERDGSRKAFKRVLDTQPENWQAVVTAFERIKKPSRREFGLMVKYYARRGDMHRARQTFESMRARGIEPTSHVYTSLIHAYAVGRDMEEALSCVRKMKAEDIELSLVTYSIIVGGFAKTCNSDAAGQWFMEAKQRCASLNGIIYGNIIYAHCQTCNMERAEALVREMEEEGIDAPIDIYHTMMDGYTMIGNEQKCLIVFERLKGASN